MASYMSNAALNIAADAVTASTVQIRLHDGAPGNSGTANRIGTAAVDVAAAGWTAASAGASATTADASFGVLNAAASETVSHYSLWQGSTFLGWADLSSDVTVPTGQAFTLTAGTVSAVFSRP